MREGSERDKVRITLGFWLKQLSNTTKKKKKIHCPLIYRKLVDECPSLFVPFLHSELYSTQWPLRRWWYPGDPWARWGSKARGGGLCRGPENWKMGIVFRAQEGQHSEKFCETKDGYSRRQNLPQMRGGLIKITLFLISVET